MLSVMKYLKKMYPTVQLLYEPESSLYDDHHPSTSARTELGPNAIDPWSPDSNSAPVDLVITLGGDGTILRASSLFKTGPVPPVLSFSMGTLGFLLPFDIHDFQSIIRDTFEQRVTVLKRMRLACTIHDADGKEIGGSTSAGLQVMNEVVLHRGRSPHLSIVDVLVDGVHLTEAFADGLIVSTPTGSTAYSLSAGGPIVHPLAKALLLSPISPRSLSFRPVVLPETSKVTLMVNSKSRTPAEISMDGHEPSTGFRVLSPGQSVKVQESPYPIPCVRRTSIAGSEMNSERNGDCDIPDGDGRSDDWVRDINTLLQFNATFRNKGILKQIQSSGN
ncbi:hypothetical protein Clacol_002676 [Clathrus columnatus]|uniref:NAD(+) kinase n=1 Tax=Clathrus columnatus TaxID=1419009 RepID=A0AAV5A741_9AGAM|nr:hypothetical protein Clacol_002676 [Clathrus columnatus]